MPEPPPDAKAVVPNNDGGPTAPRDERVSESKDTRVVWVPSTGSIVAFVFGLLGAIGTIGAVLWEGGRVSARLDHIEARIEQRAADTERRIDQRASETERTITERMDARFAAVDARFALVERRLDRIEDRLWPVGQGATLGADAGARDAQCTIPNPAIENEVSRLRGRYPGVGITRTCHRGAWGYWVEFAAGATFRVRLDAGGVFHWYTPTDEPTTPR